jgi:hypothetical protein
MTASTAGSTTAERNDESVLHSVAEAMRNAAATASEHATKVQQSASGAGYDALQTVSRLVYTSSYVLAYGIVYAAVFVAQSLPQENPVMHGLRDGGQAALDQINGD